MIIIIIYDFRWAVHASSSNFNVCNKQTSFVVFLKELLS